MKADTVVVGAGIVGLAAAREIRRRDPGGSMLILEKEDAPGLHQTGRNSGVIHAGIYYPTGSLRATLCREGVRATVDFCQSHAIPFETCGKLIVATREDELGRMNALADRAEANGIEIDRVDGETCRRMEPNIDAVAGIWSPTTGIVDYGAMARAMAEALRADGVEIRTGVRVTGGEEGPSSLRLATSHGPIEAGRAVFCAGLQADRMIRALGGSPDFALIPFRGNYYRILNQPPDLVSRLIYPVPDPARPFLGVHLTRKLDGGFTVGPSAVLAGGRESYGWGLSPSDIWEAARTGAFWKMLARNASAAGDELASAASKRLYLRKVRRYCPRIELRDLAPYKAGIRAMAIGRDGGVRDDFIFARTPRALHVGNAPSPAATAAIPIARHVADEMRV